LLRPPPSPSLFPYTTLFRSIGMTSKAVLLPLIQEGRLRALAVTSEVRWPELPDVPTLREAGFAGIPAYLWFGLLAPLRTPAAVIDRKSTRLNSSHSQISYAV